MNTIELRNAAKEQLEQLINAQSAARLAYWTAVQLSGGEASELGSAIELKGSDLISAIDASIAQARGRLIDLEHEVTRNYVNAKRRQEVEDGDVI